MSIKFHIIIIKKEKIFLGEKKGKEKSTPKEVLYLKIIPNGYALSDASFFASFAFLLSALFL